MFNNAMRMILYLSFYVFKLSYIIAFSQNFADFSNLYFPKSHLNHDPIESLLSVCSNQNLANCLCEPQSLLKKNFLEIICIGTVIEPILFEFNQISDRLYLTVVEYKFYNITTIVLRFKNDYRNNKALSAIMDCDTSIPLAKLNIDEEEALISIPLGRRVCKDPLMKLCLEYSHTGLCRCVPEQYLPPLMTFHCQGLDIIKVLTHMNTLRDIFWKKSKQCGDKNCPLDMMKVIMRDIDITDIPYNFVICGTKQTLLFSQGLKRELILSSHLNLDVCIMKDNSLDDICNHEKETTLCRCGGRDFINPSQFNYICHGNNMSLLIKDINRIQKSYKNVGSWRLKFTNIMISFLFQNLKRFENPLGPCENFTTLESKMSKEGNLLITTPVGIKICKRSIMEFCRLAEYHHPCRCVMKKIRRLETLNIKCENSPLKPLIDDLNFLQFELQKMVTWEKISFPLKILIKSALRPALILRDCETMTVLPFQILNNLTIEYETTYGKKLCMGSTYFICEKLKSSTPCRCLEVNTEHKVFNIKCNGKNISDALLNRNSIAKDILKVGRANKEKITYINLYFENVNYIPAIYDCLKKTKLHAETYFLRNITSKITVNLCDEKKIEKINPKKFKPYLM